MVTAFVTVSTLWSVSRLLFYYRAIAHLHVGLVVTTSSLVGGLSVIYARSIVKI